MHEIKQSELPPGKYDPFYGDDPKTVRWAVMPGLFYMKERVDAHAQVVVVADVNFDGERGVGVKNDHGSLEDLDWGF